MKSLIQTLLIAVTVIWLTIPVTAYDFQVDGIYYRLLSVADGSCAVSAGDVPYEGVVEIPENVQYKNKTLRVTAIETKAFKDCKNVTRIEMSDSITQIGNGAFQGCINLQFIQLSNNIEIINDDVFLDCASLEVLTLPEAVSSIGNDVIKGCSSIEVFNLPLSLVKMGSLDLSSCSKLSSLTFPPYLQEIGAIKLNQDKCINCTFVGMEDSPSLYLNTKNAKVVEDESVNSYGFPHNRLHYALISGNVSSNINLNRNIVIPEDSSNGFYTAYRYYVFENAPAILNIEDLVVSYDDKRFYYIKDGIDAINVIPSEMPITLNLSKTVNNIFLDREYSGNILCNNVNIGANITSLPYGGFSNSQLKEISIPNTVTTIGAYCFYNCRQLETIMMPSSINCLEEYVCGNCVSLKEINLGSSLERLSENSFYNVDPLLVICNAQVPPQSQENLFTKSTYLNACLVVPESSIPSYLNSSPWSNFFDVRYLAPVSEISFTSTPSILEVGSEFNFNVEYQTADELGYPDINFDLLWTTSNSEVATISNGTLLAIGPGTCEIAVKTLNSDSVSTTCEITVVPAIPDEFESDGISYRKVDATHVKVVADNYEGQIIIPSEVTVNSISLEVSQLDENAFSNCKNLTAITIPGTICYLANDQFAGCTNLREVKLSEGEKALEMGNNSYLNLSSTITPFPNPTNVDQKRTGFKNGYYDGLFYGLPIERLVINRDIKLSTYYTRSIGSSTSNYSTIYNDIIYYPPFYGLTNLKYVEIGENVSAICQNKIEAVVNAVSTNMDYVNFGECDNLEVVVSNNPSAPVGGGFSQHTYEKATLFLPNGGEESYSSDDYWKKFSNIMDTPFVEITSMDFDVDEIVMDLNDSVTLLPKINPENASIKKLKWKSSAPSVVSVSEEGCITSSTREGEVTITAFACDGSGLSAMIKVVVEEGASVSEVLVNESLDVSVENGRIFIRDKAESDVVDIYNLQGQFITSTTNRVIPLNIKGIVIIKIGTQSKKIIL